MMKTIVDTPEFTAWLMGELPVEDAAAMARTVAADPALELAAREQQQFLQQLTGLLGGSQETLDARQRDKIMSAARSQAEDVIVALPQRNSGRGWGWISLATAAVAVVGVWLGYQNPLKPNSGGLALEEVTREIALLPSDAAGFPDDSAQGNDSTAVGGNAAAAAQREALLTRQPNEFMRVMANRIATEPLPTAAELPVLSERGLIEQVKHPLAVLPIHAGTASWHWIKRSITEEQKFPHASLVRSEEIINAFAFTSGQVMNHKSFVLHAQGFIRSSGNRARIVLSLSNEGKSAAPMAWQYLPPAGSRYRLIGFAAPSSSTKVPAILAAGSRVTLMLEVEGDFEQELLGSIKLRSGDEEKQMPLSLSFETLDTAFFSLLVDFSAWLRQPQSGANEISLRIAALEAGALTAEQMTALSIMKKALNLPVK